MRYLIAESNIDAEELSARIKYIYSTFHIYILKDNSNSTNEITVLNSIPLKELSLFFIVGHDKRTDEYLKKNYKDIYEKYIVIISCNTKYFKSLKLLNNHKVFLSQNKKIIKQYDGKLYGFKFNMTDDELLLYRNRRNKLEVMLDKTLERIK